MASPHRGLARDLYERLRPVIDANDKLLIVRVRANPGALLGLLGGRDLAVAATEGVTTREAWRSEWLARRARSKFGGHAGCDARRVFSTCGKAPRVNTRRIRNHVDRYRKSVERQRGRDDTSPPDQRERD